MSDGTKNLIVARGEKSVWDKPGIADTLSAMDQDRWITAAGGAILAMVGARRGGFIGGLLAAGGLAVTVRAGMGRRDLEGMRACLDQSLRRRGWRQADVVNESSDESFPASDSPSWTSTAGARMTR